MLNSMWVNCSTPTESLLYADFNVISYICALNLWSLSLSLITPLALHYTTQMKPMLTVLGGISKFQLRTLLSRKPRYHFNKYISQMIINSKFFQINQSFLFINITVGVPQLHNFEWWTLEATFYGFNVSFAKT